MSNVPEVSIERMLRLEEMLRREWWMNHGCLGGQYGDDGEMQCCGVDFKRTPMDELCIIVDYKRLAKAFGVRPAPAHGVLWVGKDERGQVVVSHPDLKPDENGVGYIVFSPEQARNFAACVLKHAGEGD